MFSIQSTTVFQCHAKILSESKMFNATTFKCIGIYRLKCSKAISGWMGMGWNKFSKSWISSVFSQKKSWEPGLLLFPTMLCPCCQSVHSFGQFPNCVQRILLLPNIHQIHQNYKIHHIHQNHQIS